MPDPLQRLSRHTCLAVAGLTKSDIRRLEFTENPIGNPAVHLCTKNLTDRPIVLEADTPGQPQQTISRPRVEFHLVGEIMEHNLLLHVSDARGGGLYTGAGFWIKGRVGDRLADHLWSQVEQNLPRVAAKAGRRTQTYSVYRVDPETGRMRVGIQVSVVRRFQSRRVRLMITAILTTSLQPGSGFPCTVGTHTHMIRREEDMPYGKAVRVGFELHKKLGEDDPDDPEEPVNQLRAYMTSLAVV